MVELERIVIVDDEEDISTDKTNLPTTASSTISTMLDNITSSRLGILGKTNSTVAVVDNANTQTIYPTMYSASSRGTLYDNFDVEDTAPRDDHIRTIQDTTQPAPADNKAIEEVDDFDYLGTLDDSYLLSLFDEDKDDNTTPDTTPDIPTQLPAVVPSHSSNTDSAVLECSVVRRVKLPRSAKLGVTYTEDNEEEDITDNYCKFIYSLFIFQFTLLY